MKKVILFSIIAFLSCCYSCIPEWVKDKEAPTSFNFSLHNLGQTTYDYAIVYARDSNQIILDSSSRVPHAPNYANNKFTVPNSEAVGVSINLSKLSCKGEGVFEVEAKILNGKVLRHQFSSFHNPIVGQDFLIGFQDTMVIIR